ncbi:Riboflavin transporter MCH5 protein [Rutstroemia sp. NJR-2017a BBW]|nr:Riboflavin transporter MCH5 protein [Rutstroemia sp. NJR-2017a BBW]
MRVFSFRPALKLHTLNHYRGLANTFGAFQSYYQDNLLAGYSPSAIAWIGTTQGFLVNVVGVVSGRIYDLGYIKPLLYFGMFFNVLGLVTASFATTYVSIFLSLGVCVGLGSGSFYVPSLAIISSYFTTKRPLAISISANGASIGGIIYPILFRVLVERIGFVWVCRIFACMNACLLLISIFLISPRVVSTTQHKFFDPTAFRDLLYILFGAVLFLLWIGVDVPLFFIPTFVQSSLGLSAQLGDYLLAAMNASSIFGRILLGLLAVYFGSFGVWQISIGASCILLACWAAISSLPGIITFVVLYGFFISGAQSLPVSVLMVISSELDLVGTRLGMSSVLAGFGFLIGPPIASAIQNSPAGYAGQSAFAGSVYLTAFGVVGLIFWLHKRRSRRQASNAEEELNSASV